MARLGGLTLDVVSAGFEAGASPRISPDPAEIAPNLYLGSMSAVSRLADNAIKAVVDASQRSYTVPVGVRQLRLRVGDLPSEDVRQYFAESNAFIDAALRGCVHPPLSEAVLVHCQAGISRSATLAIAYLMYSGIKPTLLEAFRHTVSRKPNIQPNEGFFRQLQEYEQELHGLVTMSLLDYYEHTFIGMGFQRDHVQRVLATAGTDDYHKLVSLLHARSSRPSSAVSHLSSCPSSTEV